MSCHMPWIFDIFRLSIARLSCLCFQQQETNKTCTTTLEFESQDTMGRSQVLYNRTKGRYRNRIRNQHQQREQTSSTGNEETLVRNEDNVAKKTERKQSSASKSSSKLNEASLAMLVQSSNYYYDDLSTSESRDAASAFMENSSLDITSLATTLTRCISVSERLKIPKHVAQAIEKEVYFTIEQDTSFSVGPNKIRPTKEGDVEVRIKSFSEEDESVNTAKANLQERIPHTKRTRDPPAGNEIITMSSSSSISTMTRSTVFQLQGNDNKINKNEIDQNQEETSNHPDKAIQEDDTLDAWLDDVIA